VDCFPGGKRYLTGGADSGFRRVPDEEGEEFTDARPRLHRVQDRLGDCESVSDVENDARWDGRYQAGIGGEPPLLPP